MNNKKSFILYCDYAKHISYLSDEDAGRLFKALFEFIEEGTQPELPPAAQMAFSFISDQLLRDLEKWESISRKRSEAGKRGAKTTNSRCAHTIPANAAFAASKAADNVDVTDNVNVTDTENDNVTESSGAAAPELPPARKAYGEYKHIMLSDEEYGSLCADIGKEVADSYIKKMDEWIQIKGSCGYSDYSAAIRKWVNSDSGEGKSANKEKDPDIEKYKAFINVF